MVIKGKPVNRGGDFSLEDPCEYIFEGDVLSCEWLHRKDRKKTVRTRVVSVDKTAA